MKISYLNKSLSLNNNVRKDEISQKCQKNRIIDKNGCV